MLSDPNDQSPANLEAAVSSAFITQHIYFFDLARAANEFRQFF